MELRMTEFKVGDKVSWMGLEGIVTGDDNSISIRYPIQVEFDEYGFRCFTKDGKFYVHHTEPSLKLIERPKTKKKVTRYRAIGLYQGKFTVDPHLYETLAEAQKNDSSYFQTIALDLDNPVTFEVSE